MTFFVAKFLCSANRNLRSTLRGNPCFKNSNMCFTAKDSCEMKKIEEKHFTEINNRNKRGRGKNYVTK
jgi:hypothetical protein